jgi:ABC-type dipeptide/oligopeptide/nickel transport system permease component
VKGGRWVMTMYLIRRLGRALITLVLVTIITFTVLYTIPANI